MLKTVSSITNAIGALNYKGTWDASTNTPTLASGVGTKGDYYVVSVAGSTALDGISNWGVGDWAAYNGSVWQRVEGGVDGNFVNLSVTGTSTLAVTTATSINKVVLTAPATGSTLTIADGKTITASNTLTLAGTDATTMTFPTTNATIARTDAAQSFTGNQKVIGNVITSLDQTGSYAIASFGKTSIARTVATNICVLTGDAEMFGFIEVLYAIEDPGTDVYVGRKTYRMFWAGGTALFILISSEDSGALVPTFTSSGSGNDFTLKVTAVSIAATYNANFTIRWHTYGVPFSAIAITEA
jgi:hypothetical protein